jgi:hypothetical protein
MVSLVAIPLKEEVVGVKKHLICLLIVLGLSQTARAAFEKQETNAASGAMAGLGLAWPQPSSSLFENPAWLGSSNRLSASVFYTRLFNLTDLSYQTVSLEGSFSKYGWGLGATDFGNPLYREQTLALGTSAPLGPRARLGMALKGFRTRISGYGETNAWGVDLGAAGRIRRDLTFGACATNLNRPKLGKAGEELPQSLSAGALFRPLPMLAIGSGLEEDPRYGTSFRAGSEVQVGRHLLLRGGMRTNPNALTAGFGVALRGLALDYSLRTHPTLGATHGFGLGYRR